MPNVTLNIRSPGPRGEQQRARVYSSAGSTVADAALTELAGSVPPAYTARAVVAGAMEIETRSVTNQTSAAFDGSTAVRLRRGVPLELLGGYLADPQFRVAATSASSPAVAASGTSPATYRGSAVARSAVALFARVLDALGRPAVGGDVASVTVKVWDVEAAALVATLDPSTVTVYDTLQTDARWTEDAIGFNLSIQLPASALPAAGRYRVEAKCAPTGDASGAAAFYAVFELSVSAILSE